METTYPIVQTEEGKAIIEAINKLTPWDRSELVAYLAYQHLTDDEIYHAFIEGTDYDKSDEWTDECTELSVDDVFNAGLERQVLEDMDEDDIAEVIIDGHILPSILDNLTDRQMDNLVEEMKKGVLERLFASVIHML